MPFLQGRFLKMIGSRQVGDQNPRKDAAYLPGTFISAYIEATRSLDLDPYHQLRQARFPVSNLDCEALVVPYGRFIALLESTAQLAHRPDFALVVAKAINLGSFGPVGLLASAQPTLREALGVLREDSTHPQRKMRLALEMRGEVAVIRFSPRGDRLSRHCSELALGVVVQVIRALVGDPWRPQSTAFSTPSPQDLAPFAAFFGDVVFDQPFDELRLRAADLARRIPTANPALSRLVGHYLTHSVAPNSTPFEDEVRELIGALLPRGLCTLEHIADRLGVDRRTVHRRLAEQGLSFSELLETARKQIVAAELQHLPIAKLAQALGFASSSAFSRWFRQTYGVSASKLRQAA